MSVIIDVALLLIILLNAIIGLIKGFADRILGLLTGIVSFILAIVFAPSLSSLIYTKFMFEKLTNAISVKLNSLSEGSNLKTLLEEGAANDSFRQFLTRVGVDYGTVSEKISEGGEDSLRSVSESIAAPVARVASYAIAFIAIFLTALLLMILLRLLFKLLVKLPALKKADRTLGFIFGIVAGIAIVWVISIALKMSLPYLSAVFPETFSEDLFEKSIILRLFYNLNAFKGLFNTGKISEASLLIKMIK